MTTEQSSSTDLLVGELSTEIDRALAHLNEADRGAIVLRYFRDEPLAAVASALNLSEQAAAKRLSRALGKLRDYFSRHPIAPSIISLEAMMRKLPRATPPASVVHSASTAAFSTSATAKSSLIANQAMKMIFWSKAKFAAAAALAALLGATAIGTIVHAQAGVPASAPAAALAPAYIAPPDKGAAAIARLSNGVSMEIVGINANPSNGKPWWGVDGSPVPAPPPMRGMLMNGGMAGNVTMYEVVARVNDKIDGKPNPASIRWALAGNSAGISFPARVAGNNGLQRHFFPVKKNDPTTLRVDVATGEWKTLLQSGTDGKSLTLGNENISIGAASEEGGRVNFSLTQNTGINEARQVVVIDTLGKIHNIMAQGFGNNGKTENINYNVTMSLKSIKEIQLQSRPYEQWMEMSNVCLDPAHPTQVKVTTSDDAPQGL